MGKIKYIGGFVIVFMFALNTATRIQAQDCLSETGFTCLVSTFGPTTLLVVGLAVVSNVATREINSGKLSETEWIEARDQLLEYQARKDASLKDYQFVYRYPMLNRYIEILKEKNREYRSRSTADLVEIAAKHLLSE